MNWTKRLKKWHFVAPSVLATVIAIAYFTAGPRVPMDNDQTSELAIAENQAEKADESVAEFGKDIAVGDITVNLTEPEAIKITDEFVDFGEMSPNLIVATLTNNSSSRFEAYSFSLGTPVVENNPDAYCEQFFPMQDDVPPAPENLELEPGKSLSFYWVYGCEAAVGDPVTINVTVTDESLITLSTTIK